MEKLMQPDNGRAVVAHLVVAAAANDPSGPREREPTSFVLRDGWDPYEVWRTRVRDARTVLRPPEPVR
jgi:hypothetical protein